MHFITFWNMSSENLPEEYLRKRRLTIDEAKLLIERARERKELVCVSKDDLVAPYKQRQRLKHV